MDVLTATLADLGTLADGFSNRHIRRVSDYLRGNHLGPDQGLAFILPGGKTEQVDVQTSVSYWAGDLLDPSDRKFGKQVEALKKSFVSRNVTLEGVELLVDGVGADEPDWQTVVARELAEGEQPTPEEDTLIAELDAVLTTWWDRNDLPSLLQRVMVYGVAHGRQAVRPRIPKRYKTKDGQIKPMPLERALDGLHLTVPETWDSSVHVDPETLERYGVTRVWVPGRTGALEPEYEVTYLTEDGETVLRRVDAAGEVTETDPMDLGGMLWLLELKFFRAAVTADVIQNQDMLNVGLTNLSRNTRWAGFEKTILIGLEPPMGEDGRPRNMGGPGSENWISPMVTTTEEQTGEVDAGGNPIKSTVDKLFGAPEVVKLEPAKPEAIQASIDQAITNVQAILKQQFMGMVDDANASGRSREVAVGPYLRAVARYATAVEAFIRDLLTLAAKFAAIAQEQPGRYDGLRFNVTCRQRVFEPSPEVIRIYLELFKEGVVSMQTLRGIAGLADPDAEEQQVLKELEARAAKPETEEKNAAD